MDALYFNTVNDVKIREIREIFSSSDIEPLFLRYPITEVLNHEIKALVRAKVIAAYEHCRVPVVVEHGALYIEYLNEFPGPLSKPMWDLMNDKICRLIPPGESRNAKAISGVGYCDGKIARVFTATTLGEISLAGRGMNGFQWDPIFIPKGATRTYAEMEQTEKLTFSQAAKAYTELKDFLHIKR